MASKRLMRRTAGFLFAYIGDNLLRRVAHKADGRSKQGRRWKNPIPLFMGALLALASGCKGPTEAEELMGDMPRGILDRIGIRKAIPDTTLRTFLCKAAPEALCELLYIVGYDAWRRGALRQVDADIAFHAMSLDGKYPSVSDVGESKDGEKSKYLQVHHDQETGEATHGLVRTITATLVTAIGRPIMAATPVPGATNEKGAFQKALGDLVRYYGALFAVVLYDAGATSKANARAVLNAGKHYFFQVADPRWVMHQTMTLLFKDEVCGHRDEETVSSTKRIVREITILPSSPTGRDSAEKTIWDHTKTLVRVVSTTYEDGVAKTPYIRYFVTSLDATTMTAAQFLRLVVLRWGVETSHGILDMHGAFEEDDHPWIHADANGNLVVQLLRRVVYTLLTLYRSVTIRMEEHANAPWRRHLKWVRDTLENATEDVLTGLRTRTFQLPPALA